MKYDRRKQQVQEAWVGDAVLSLYARRLILAEAGAVDSAALERMTSNQFLASIGEPTSVEAELGRVYEAEGLDAAFRWIEAKLIPIYRKQNAAKGSPGR